ncbi:MAG: hypothetical protein LBP75_03395 [Planctomycetota bacterium]|nr:hypothetical protein [Planctomycetota bacterium]
MIFRRAGLALPENPPCKGSGNFLLCPYRARYFYGRFLPSALRWAVTRRPVGATVGDY